MSTGLELPDTLAAAARAVVADPDPAGKVARAATAATAWREGRLSLGRRTGELPMPERPGRPPRPLLLPPREMPKRSAGGLKGRIALLHSLAHIELNAVDMTWDLIGRFWMEPVPRAFFDNWVQVGEEEARHFDLLSRRLVELGSFYGDLPAHDGLWQTAQETGRSLLARVAVVPLVLEARGLDVTPSIQAGLAAAGDAAAAGILGIIYEDEKGHVAYGCKWFRWLCEREGLAPEPTFHELVRRHFKGRIKPPFNDKARSEAGLAPGFYKPLAALGR